MARPLLSITTPARMLLVGLASVLLTGCGIPTAILWTPDSSSIIYRDHAGRLIRYDLKRKARKIIVADTKTDTPWPAISKDGKKLAVANFTTSRVKGSREAKHKLQLIFYDSLSGEKLSETKVHEYTTNLDEPAKSTTEDRQEDTALNWSGPPDKLLVGSDVVWIYDLEKDNFTPIQAYPFPVYNRPVRPDGKGFLAFLPMKDGDGGSFVFYDWNGWETSIGKWKPKKDERILHGVWEKNIYQISTSYRVLSIDTENRKITERQVKPNFLASSGQLMSFFPFAGSESQLCVFRQSKDDTSTYHVEIKRPLLKQRKVVVTIDDFDIIGSLFPSPDNKLVAIHSSDKEIVVINAEGEIVANIAR